MKKAPKLTQNEAHFFSVLWEYEPIRKASFVKLCQNQFGWKSSYTHFLIKQLVARGLLKNENTLLTSLINKDDIPVSLNDSDSQPMSIASSKNWVSHLKAQLSDIFPNKKSTTIIAGVAIVALFITLFGIVAGLFSDKADQNKVPSHAYYCYSAENDRALLTILDEKNTCSFSFSLDGPDSFLGTYKEDGDFLIMSSKDKKTIYTFQKKKDALVFVADKSSPVPTYSSSSDKKGEAYVPDGAVFEII